MGVSDDSVLNVLLRDFCVGGEVKTYGAGGRVVTKNNGQAYQHIGPRFREPLADAVPNLIATARGDMPATLVIENGKLVNVTSGEILHGFSVAVQGSRIAYIGPDATHTIGDETQVIDATGLYIAPGLLDGHCHIESSQLTVREFARAVLPLGTTGGFFDAHEIVNVLGLPGLRMMLEEGRMTPLMAYMQVASCVPASDDELETTGAHIGPDEVAEACAWGPDVVALGEVMNFPGVVFGDKKMIGEIQAALRAGRVVDGHFTWPADDWRLAAYAAAGVSGDHESVSAEDIIWRLRHGMYAKMRRGSAWHDVAASIKAHTEYGLDSRRLVLVTDDRSPESLVDEGHMNFVLQHAIEQGVSPVTAFQMATINTAERFQVSADVGSVSPSRYADIILLDGNLSDVNVVMTIAAGQVVAENGQTVADIPRYEYPEEAVQTVHLQSTLTPQTFSIPVDTKDNTARARVIQVIENSVETKERIVDVPVQRGQLQPTIASDICKLVVIERHGKNGDKGLGLVSGIGFEKPAALATTVAHDSHNLMVIGNNDELMAQVANEVIRMQGGIAVVVAEDETSLSDAVMNILPLPVAGLMSQAPYEEVANASRTIGESIKSAGCTLNYAFMTLSLLALVVLPELHISDQGLVRISESGFEKADLLV